MVNPYCDICYDIQVLIGQNLINANKVMGMDHVTYKYWRWFGSTV